MRKKYSHSHPCLLVATIWVELVYLFIYACDIYHRYEISWSDGGDISNEQSHFFPILQLFGSKSK